MCRPTPHMATLLLAMPPNLTNKSTRRTNTSSVSRLTSAVSQLKFRVDELKRILLNNIAGLSEVERTVIRERFALGPRLSADPLPPKTLEQVGGIIGVTKERVRQIQNNALKKIRRTLEEEYLAA